MKKVIFTLTSARSGTLHLAHLFRHNVEGCVCRHEPFFDWGNPAMFGRVIGDVSRGRLDSIRKCLARKQAYINRCPGEVYLESSHAFLKSAYAVALEFFPAMQLIHLVRDPLRAARSESYRTEWRRRLHAPFHHYTGDDGRRRFVWALTGDEPIFHELDGAPLTPFQWHLLQWIEIENRAMRFLDEHQLHSRCFTLRTPHDLNDPARVEALFKSLDVRLKHSPIALGGRTNRSLGPRIVVRPQKEREADAILSRIPVKYLEIFQRAPYKDCEWQRRFLPGRMRMIRERSGGAGCPPPASRSETRGAVRTQRSTLLGRF